MTATMKGLLKGLRYISQIFEGAEEEEPEMEIGNPTDVKHVAHIGWDGPAVSSPSWINDFKPNESTSAPLNFSGPKESPITRRHSEDVFAQDATESPKHNTDDQKHSRRRHSAGGAINSSEQDPKPRRHHHRNSSIEADSSPNAPSAPKKTRKKKPKDNEGSSKSGSGSSKPRKGRKSSDLNMDAKPKNSEIDCPSAALQALGLDEKKESGKDLDL